VWRVTEHEDWLDAKKDIKADELNKEGEELDQGNGNQPEDRQKVVEGFRAEHSAIDVDLSDVIKVSYTIQRVGGS